MSCDVWHNDESICKFTSPYYVFFLLTEHLRNSQNDIKTTKKDDQM